MNGIKYINFSKKKIPRKKEKYVDAPGLKMVISWQEIWCLYKTKSTKKYPNHQSGGSMKALPTK